MKFFIKNFILLSVMVFAGTVSAATIPINGSGSSIASFRNTDFGVVNFAPSGDGITVSDTGLSGYAWGEIIGWINMSPSEGGVANTCSGELSGYAWSERMGWINFNPTKSSVSIDLVTGNFSGDAWVENSGWLNFSCPGASCVNTDWRGCSSDDGGGGGNSVGSYVNIINFEKSKYSFEYTGGDFIIKAVLGKNNNGTINANISASSKTLVFGKDFNLSVENILSGDRGMNIIIKLSKEAIIDQEHTIKLWFDSISGGITTKNPETFITIKPKEIETTISQIPEDGFNPPPFSINTLFTQEGLANIFTNAISFGDQNSSSWFVEEAYAIGNGNSFSEPDPVCYILHRNILWVAFIKLLASLGLVSGILGFIFHYKEVININQHPLWRLPQVLFGSGFVANLFFLGNCYSYWEFYLTIAYIVLATLFFVVIRHPR